MQQINPGEAEKDKALSKETLMIKKDYCLIWGILTIAVIIFIQIIKVVTPLVNKGTSPHWTYKRHSEVRNQQSQTPSTLQEQVIAFLDFGIRQSSTKTEQRHCLGGCKPVQSIDENLQVSIEVLLIFPN